MVQSMKSSLSHIGKHDSNTSAPNQPCYKCNNNYLLRIPTLQEAGLFAMGRDSCSPFGRLSPQTPLPRKKITGADQFLDSYNSLRRNIADPMRGTVISR